MSKQGTERDHEGLPAIPGYDVLDVLGEGGQGKVYRARQLSLDRIVAIKILSKADARDPERTRRFKDEARLASQLHHPNILQGIDIGHHGDTWYFVMEFVSGDDLRSLMHLAPWLEERQALHYALQVSRALEYAHERGIVHGDVKPENLVVSHDDIIKVVDFGSAKRARNERHGDLVEGTEGYMAPEVVAGRTRGDIASDLYSLGITLFEMLTDSFPDKTEIRPEGADPRRRRVELEPATARIVSKLTAANRKKRYGRPSEVVQALESHPLLAGEPAVARAVAGTSPAPVARTRRRRSRSWAGPIVAMLVLIAAGVAAFKFLGNENRNAPVPRTGSGSDSGATKGDTPTDETTPKPGTRPAPETGGTPPPNPRVSTEPRHVTLVSDPKTLEVGEGEELRFLLRAEDLRATLSPVFRLLDAERRELDRSVPLPTAAPAQEDSGGIIVSWTAPWSRGQRDQTYYIVVSQPPLQESLPVTVRNRNRAPTVEIASEADPVEVTEGAAAPVLVPLHSKDPDGDDVKWTVKQAPELLTAHIRGDSLALEAPDRPGNQGETVHVVELRAADGNGATLEANLRVRIVDVDHPLTSTVMLGKGWSLEEAGGARILRGPVPPPLLAEVTIGDPDQPGDASMKVTADEEAWPKGLAWKERGDGRYRIRFALPVGEGWGPRPFRVRVIRPTGQEEVLRFRLQALRTLEPPPDGSTDPLDLALRWLADHQLQGGSWPMTEKEYVALGVPEDLAKQSAGAAANRIGVSALCTLAALRSGVGETWVVEGVRYLCSKQDEEGCFGSRDIHHFIYGHLISTECVATAYHLLGNPEFKVAAEKGLRFTARARNPGPTGAWRYGVQPRENDSSVTTWALRALLAGRMSGLPVDASALSGGFTFLRSLREKGRIGYTKPGELPVRANDRKARHPGKLSEALTAGALSVLVHAEGFSASDRAWKEALRTIRSCPPAWTMRMKQAVPLRQRLTLRERRFIDSMVPADFYYWQHASALFRAWKGVTDRQPSIGDWGMLYGFLKKGQRARGPGRGSFDPIGPWGPDGGRAYATATLALALANTKYDKPLLGEF